jgi:hypothetical protein
MTNSDDKLTSLPYWGINYGREKFCVTGRGKDVCLFLRKKSVLCKSIFLSLLLFIAVHMVWVLNPKPAVLETRL